MVALAMSEPHPKSIASDKEEEVAEVIRELIAEFGVRCVVSAVLKSEAGTQFEHTGGNATLRVIQATLREIVFSQDPQLEAEIMALGAGVLLEDKQTMRTVAAKHGITWQAVSKRVVKFVKKWQLPPSVFMRSEKDRDTYALCNKPRIA